MVVFSSLVLTACGWAFGCCLIYAALRWINIEMPFLVQICGAASLVMCVTFFIGTATLANFTNDTPRPWGLILGIGAALSGGFAIGSVLLMLNTNKRESWLHNTWLSALYLGCAQTLGYMILISWPATNGPLFQIAHWSGRPNDPHGLMLFAWLFPLGAPLAEIAFRSYKRAHATNKTGSLV